MKSKSFFIIGRLTFGNALWLEYHSNASDNIYMTIVSDEKDIKKLQSLNLIVGSPESYSSYCDLIQIAMKAGLKVPKDNNDLAVKMRFCMCNSITVIKNYENTIIED